VCFREAQPGAAGRAIAGAVGAEQRLEQLWQVVGLDSGPVVEDLEADVCLVGADAQLDPRAGVTRGVVEQINQHSQEHGTVAIQRH
jgi:hypothetical protein